MAIDGLIFLDKNRRPIVQSGFRSSPAAYPLLHIDAIATALEKATSPADVDPVLSVNSGMTYGASACCHMESGDVRILCPISEDLDPLVAFSFMQTFVDILREYFGAVNAVTLTENFDVVYQLLEETLDVGGYPLTTSPNALRDIVLPPSLLSKLLSVTGANFNSTINSGSSGSGPFSSPIPWRKAGVRYNNNEVYFDVVEEIKGIINKHGTTISTNVWGKVEANARLSGTPDCTLKFTNANVLIDPAFHPCVRLQRWSRERCLSFVPPDGRFTLFEYQYTPNPTSITPTTIPLPVLIKPTIVLTETGGSFDIAVISRLPGQQIESFVMELNLGPGASNVKCETSQSGAGNRGSGAKATSWSFDSQKQVIKITIPTLLPSSSLLFKGTFLTASYPHPLHALLVQFEIPSHTFSSLKVDQLKITTESYKPYKGVRGRSVGNLEWRW